MIKCPQKDANRFTNRVIHKSKIACDANFALMIMQFVLFLCKSGKYRMRSLPGELFRTSSAKSYEWWPKGRYKIYVSLFIFTIIDKYFKWWGSIYLSILLLLFYYYHCCCSKKRYFEKLAVGFCLWNVDFTMQPAVVLICRHPHCVLPHYLHHRERERDRETDKYTIKHRYAKKKKKSQI